MATMDSGIAGAEYLFAALSAIHKELLPSQATLYKLYTKADSK